jgi:hypothetical protein
MDGHGVIPTGLRRENFSGEISSTCIFLKCLMNFLLIEKDIQGKMKRIGSEL